MSFGFGVGDFLAVIKLANEIRTVFAGAPDQFKQITADVRNLSIVLQDVEVFTIEHDVTEAQEKNLHEIRESCRLDSRGGTHRERAKRLWKRVQWEPDEIRDLRSRITANITALNAFTAANTRDNVTKLVERQDQQQRKEILDWLTPIGSAPQQSDVICRRQEGTGQWLIDSPEYAKWQTTKGEILFCYGIPGAGKTILSSIVVDDLQENYCSRTDVAICYFYCDFKRQGEQSLESVTLNILRQLGQAGAGIPGSLKVLFDRCQAKSGRPSRDEAIRTLHSVIGSFSRTFIVVDALDECQTSDSCQKELISQLIELQRLTNVNILATSRPVPHIMDRFRDYTSLEIRASKDDIKCYVNGNKQDLPGFVNDSPELLEEVTTAIVGAVDGMFLLAKLHLDSLKGKRSPRKLREVLATLAKGNDAYDEAYRNTMLRIHGQLADQKDLANQTLMWIVHAKRPLTTIELVHALSVEVGEREFFEDNTPNIGDTLSACCGLVAVDGESDIIRLIHYTTQEFFDRHRNEYFPRADVELANTCITYLSFDEFRSGPCQEEEDSYGRTPLSWAAENGHEAVVQLLLDKNAQVDLADIKYGRTPLSWAAKNGYKAVVQLLLDKNAQVDTTDNIGRTPLFWAAWRTPLSWAAENGHKAIVQLLLDKNAQVDTTDNIGRTPLLWAAWYGQEAVVQLLLNKNAQVDLADIKYRRTPLSWAAKNGHEAVVQLLLDKNAQVDTTDNIGRTPLSWAAWYGHEAVVQLLLDKNGQADTLDIIRC
ncbi:hypothetical protein SCUP515_07016 [Seiridium cupressi]